jgi:hypothetical protein
MKLADFNDASVPDALSWVAEGCYWIVSHPMEENINSPKEMNAVSTKGTLSLGLQKAVTGSCPTQWRKILTARRK